MVEVLFVRVCGGSTVAVELRPFTNAQSPQIPARQRGHFWAIAETGHQFLPGSREVWPLRRPPRGSRRRMGL